MVDMKALDSIKASCKASSGQNLKLFLLILAEVVVIFIGVLALGIGVLPAAFIAYLMFGVTYRQHTANT